MYEHLFSPIKINSMELANRIVMPAMHLNYTMGGEVTDQLIDFYRERAEGEAALLFVGGCSIDKTGAGFMMVGLSEDRFLPGLKKLVDSCHIGEVKIGAQLYHAGRYSWEMLIGTQPIAPSAIPSRLTGETPREMTIEDIRAVQDAFGDAALRAKEAGFDTVEVCGSAGYLIPQFLSPVTNQRDDEYGGCFENRARFGVEVIQNVRGKVGDDYPIFMRIAGNDFMQGGQTNKDSARACKHFQDAGIDAFNVTGGWHETRVPQLTMSVPRGAYVYLAQGIRQQVSVPVVACNRINNPMLAEKILRENRADLIGIGRGLIADPQFPVKAREGRAREIRSCIACNQGCFDMVFKAQGVCCLVNARVGREAETEIKKTDQPKKVVVVGGGAAGMEAARCAAERGHQVVLFEKHKHLGGLLNLCAAPPGRAEFNTLIEYLSNEIQRLGVKIKMGVNADRKLIDAENPDRVIVATGSKPIRPAFVDEAMMDNVFMADDVLEGRADVIGDVVIIGGGAVGTETALYLAEKDVIDPEVANFLIAHNAETYEEVSRLLTHRNGEISIIEMLGRVGTDIGKTTRWTIKQDLRRHQVNLLTGTTLLAIESNSVLVKNQDGVKENIPTDNVVIAVGYVADDALVKQLAGAKYPVDVIGDAKGARKAIDAIAEGFDAALRI